MRNRSFWLALWLSLLLTLTSGGGFVLRLAQAAPPFVMAQSGDGTGKPDRRTNTSAAPQPDSAGKEQKPAPEKNFATEIAGLDVQDGFVTVYRDRKKQKLLAALRPEQLNRYYLMVTSISRGVGEFGLYRGMPLQDFPLTLRQVDDAVQVVVPNLYFRTSPDDLLGKTLKDSFSDSVLYTLPILATHPEDQRLLVDVSPLFLGEPIALSALMPLLQSLGYRPDPELFALKAVNNLAQNLELDTTYEFKSGKAEGSLGFGALPDNSALTLGVHYSFSALPWNNGYQPRPADERIGYFVTAYRDIGAREQSDPFVRSLNRWFLEKAEPEAALSRPKQPIVLWIENTVPEEYRSAFRDGALMWNQAFENIGFQDAIEVKQMPDDADWDPADIRYNTLRWFEAVDGDFALGPSRVNPFNGQILDGDVLVGSGLVRYAQEEYRTLTQPGSTAAETLMPSLGQAIAQRLQGQIRDSDPSSDIGLSSDSDPCASVIDLQTLRRGEPSPRFRPAGDETRFAHRDRCFSTQMTQQYAYGSLALSSLRQVLPSSDAAKDYIHQYLTSLIAHEVGHLLGLRHNFQGSDWLSPAELNDPSITRSRGMVASVMDYVPVNLAPAGVTQGDYFPQVIGPYDEWAIEYGYRPVPEAAGPAAERRMLEAIASRAAEPGLAYATDEDTIGLDPRVHRFDLSNDLLTYNAAQLEQTRQLWEKLNLRGPGPGSRYSDLRRQFSILLNHYMQNAVVLNDYIGGQQFNRYRAGDAPGQLPLTPVPLTQQRQALQVLSQNVFNAEALALPPQLLDKLPPPRWFHWGQSPSPSLEYPFYDQVSLFQTFMLSDLLSSDRLSRLRNAELRRTPQATLSLEELFSTLHRSIWSAPLGNGEISTLQRGLQRQHLAILSNMTLRNSKAAAQATSLADWIASMMTVDAPEDARALARSHLQQLRTEVQAAGRKSRDRTTRAHCEDIEQRIEKVLAAPIIGS